MRSVYTMLFVLALSVMPLTAFAGNSCGGQGLERVICTVGMLIGGITPVITALALLGFFWGLAMYVLNFSGEEKDKKKGRDIMVYGVLTLFVMVSIWGIVQVIQATFLPTGFDSRQNNLPCIKIEGGLPCED